MALGVELVDLRFEPGAGRELRGEALKQGFGFAVQLRRGDPIGGFNAAVQSSTEWTVLEGPFSVGALGSFRVHADASGPTDAFVEIDEIRFVEAAENRGIAGGYLYFDDFEGGGFCRWTFAVKWDLRGAE